MEQGASCVWNAGQEGRFVERSRGLEGGRGSPVMGAWKAAGLRVPVLQALVFASLQWVNNFHLRGCCED